MIKNRETEFPRLEVIPAAEEQAPILANLLELYAHDFSEFHHLDIGEHGRFGYPALRLYWSEPRRHPFLVRLEGKLAGFALVKKGSQATGDDSVWDMVEFFIIRGCRRRGIGTRAAHEVWRRFPGPWEVRVMQANVAARHFWAGAISRFTGKTIQPVRIEIGGRSWFLFSFQSVP